MMHWNQKIHSFILRHSVLLIILFALLTLKFSFLLPKIEIDSSADIFFDRQGQSYLKLQDWKKQFGNDEHVIIAFSDKNIFTEKNLTLISKLTDRLELLENVDNIRSLTNVNNIIGQKNDFIVEKLIEEIPSDKDALAKLKTAALRNPLYVKNVISKDAKTTALIVELENHPSKNSIYKKEVIDNISQILKEKPFARKTYYLSGLPVIECFFAAYMQKDLRLFIPLMLVVITGILYFTFRKIKIVILPLICIVIILTLTMPLLYFLGFSINNVTTMIPPILMAIAIADSIHFIDESIGKQKSTAIENTMRHLLFPCFLTTVTTTVGFLALSLNRIPPVRQLGIVAAAGITIAFIVTFTFLPALAKQMNLFSNENNKPIKKKDFIEKKLNKYLLKLGDFNKKYKFIILMGTLLLIGICFVGITRIKVETSVLEYFQKDSPIYQSTTYIEDHLTGIQVLNISFKSDVQDYFKNPEVLKEIEQLRTFLQTIKEVDTVTSVTDYIKDIHQSFHNENSAFYKIPDSKNLIAQYLLLYGQNDLNSFVDSQWQWTTVRVHLKEHSTTRLKKIIKRIEQYLKTHRFAFPQFDILGQTVLEVESNNAVTKGQMRSLGLAMIVIFGMMFLVFRSIPIGLVSIIPNILPLLINFGIMGWFGIRLDSATSMISAIGIGIIVDDTIHFLHTFEESLKETAGDYTQAMYNTLVTKGRPIILTSVILFFGFGVVIFSKFVPTSYFGLLSALIMINALLADLIILPCVLLFFKPRFHGMQ